MLPPGHLAGGFLTAEALLKVLKPNLPRVQINQLVWWGIFFSFAPDLDTFFSFLKEKAWFVKSQNNNHRKFVSHAPVVWMLVGVVISLVSGSIYWKLIGLLLWLCSWTHFLLDSIEYGIMWLWPLSNKVFALRNREREFKIDKSDFFGYWWAFVKAYLKTLTFYCEIFLIIIAIYYSLTTIH